MIIMPAHSLPSETLEIIFFSRLRRRELMTSCKGYSVCLGKICHPLKKNNNKTIIKLIIVQPLQGKPAMSDCSDRNGTLKV